jgi:ATP-dependent protease ClpP protease subunit
MKTIKHKQTSYKLSNSKLSDDDLEEYFPNNKQQHLPFFEQSQSFTQTKITIYLDEDIKEVMYYRPIIEKIRSLGEHDEVELIINSPGGSVQSAISLINAIQSTDASVVAVVDNYAGSAASLIALACPAIGVAPHSTVMLHNYTMGSFGKGGDITTHVNYTDAAVKKLMQEVYLGFLSDKEMQELFMGRDFYFNTEETTTRLEQRSKYFEKLHAEDTPKPARKASKRSKPKIDTEVAAED